MYAHSPKLLLPGIAKELNYRAYNSTGCFYFLNTDTLPLHRSLEAQGSFQALVIVLYCLYHDYGRDFLTVCLSEAFMPPGSAIDQNFMNQRRRAETHVITVCKVLRTGLCHGSFPYDKIRYIFPKTLDAYCKGQIADERDSWNDACVKVEQYTKSDWKRAQTCLIQESDALHKYLSTWAESWDNENDVQKNQLMQKFFREARKCLNMSLAEPVMKVEYASFHRNRNDYKNDRVRLQNALEGFQNNIQNKFVSYAFKTPEEIYQGLAQLVKNHITPLSTSSLQKSKGTVFDVTT
jgi:hypothetical protein